MDNATLNIPIVDEMYAVDPLPAAEVPEPDETLSPTEAVDEATEVDPADEAMPLPHLEAATAPARRGRLVSFQVLPNVVLDDGENLHQVTMQPLTVTAADLDSFPVLLRAMIATAVADL